MNKLFSVIIIALAQALVGCEVPNGPTTVSREKLISVPAKLSLAERIDIAQINPVGQYIDGTHFHHADKRITLGFKAEQVNTDYVAKMVEVHFNRSISSKQAVAEIKALGLHPANAVECLAYGAHLERLSQRPNADDSDYYWVACLGSTSTVEGLKYSLALNQRLATEGKWINTSWNIDHASWPGDWRYKARFLALRP